MIVEERPAPIAKPEVAADKPIPLESGDRLTATEFMRRYEAMPEVKKAELIQGIVYMASPVRVDQHGIPDSLAQTWLGNYAVSTPGTHASINATAKLGPRDVLQPDGMMWIDQECGGQSRIEDGYLVSGPELAIEIAASSASIDAHVKKASYLQAGIREYIVWRTRDAAIDWWYLFEDEYHLLAPDDDGILQSRVFPGLWLDAEAMIAQDGPRVLEVLNQGLTSDAHRAFADGLKTRGEE